MLPATNAVRGLHVATMSSSSGVVLVGQLPLLPNEQLDDLRENNRLMRVIRPISITDRFGQCTHDPARVSRLLV